MWLFLKRISLRGGHDVQQRVQLPSPGTERETNSQNGHSVGACYAWSCPLGYEADEEDFVSQEIDSRGYTEWEENTFIVVEEK